MSRIGPARQVWRFEPLMPGRALGWLLSAMNTLHETFGVPGSRNEAVTNAVVAAWDVDA